MSLEEVRKQIDQVDNEMKALFVKRMGLAEQVAMVKAKTADDIFKPDREEVIITNRSADIADNLKLEYIAFIKRMMAISRKFQYGKTLELRDDCLSFPVLETLPEFTNIAMVNAELYLCDMYDKNSVTTVDNLLEVGQLVKEHKADAGIGILETVGMGANDQLHEMLVKQQLYIYRCEDKMDGEKCRKMVAFSDKLYVDKKHNRLKLMFVCKNNSGSLANILSMIADYNINLSEIHSTPNQEKEWNYQFFVELHANYMEQDTKALLFQLQSETQEFHILGSYYYA